jgi:hypothetical protein
MTSSSRVKRLAYVRDALRHTKIYIASFKIAMREYTRHRKLSDTLLLSVDVWRACSFLLEFLFLVYSTLQTFLNLETAREVTAGLQPQF